MKDLLRFAHHLSGKRGSLIAIFALGLGGAAVSLSTPLLGKVFVDAVASRRDFTVIPKITAVLLVLAVLDLGLARCHAASTRAFRRTCWANCDRRFSSAA